MDAVCRLAQHPNIVGLKDSGGDVRSASKPWVGTGEQGGQYYYYYYYYYYKLYRITIVGFFYIPGNL